MYLFSGRVDGGSSKQRRLKGEEVLHGWVICKVPEINKHKFSRNFKEGQPDSQGGSNYVQRCHAPNIATYLEPHGNHLHTPAGWHLVLHLDRLLPHHPVRRQKGKKEKKDTPLQHLISASDWGCPEGWRLVELSVGDKHRRHTWRGRLTSET